MKVPYIAVLGAREAESGTVSVRRRGGGGEAVAEPQAAFVARLRTEAESRAAWGNERADAIQPASGAPA
jgi:threonyl-tRNA synthetase